MNIKNIEYIKAPLAKIDFSDERNRITLGDAGGFLKKSIRELGIINPPLVAENGAGGFRIICGFRRVMCARAESGHEPGSGVPDVLITCALARGFSEADEIAASVEDNAASRRLGPVEISSAIAGLSKYFDKKFIIEKYFDSFGIQKSEFAFARYLEIASLSDAARDAVASGKLPMQAASFLVEFSRKRQEDFMRLASDCRMGANLLTEMAKNIFEISRQRRVAIDSIFETIGLENVISDDKLNSNEKSGLLRERVLDLKFPEYRSRLGAFQESVKKLGCAGVISVNPFPYFEKDEINVSFTIKNASEVKKRIGDIRKFENSDLIKEFVGND